MMIHYDVQLIGGIVMDQGKIEMQTGEGKTLSTLPVFFKFYRDGSSPYYSKRLS